MPANVHILFDIVLFSMGKNYPWEFKNNKTYLELMS